MTFIPGLTKVNKLESIILMFIVESGDGQTNTCRSLIRFRRRKELIFVTIHCERETDVICDAVIAYSIVLLLRSSGALSINTFHSFLARWAWHKQKRYCRVCSFNLIIYLPHWTSINFGL
jgi:hypothetical protein